MTNKEAIIWLRGIREQFAGNCTTDTLVPISRCDIQAIDLAIKALEERPQGDLISREALKEAIRKRLCISSLKYLTEQEKVIVDEIDNAPTIEAKTTHDVNSAYDRGFITAMKEYSRPQGKWIIDGHHRRCNCCNEYTCTEDREGNSIPDNFCPNCGASMQKGDAE